MRSFVVIAVALLASACGSSPTPSGLAGLSAATPVPGGASGTTGVGTGDGTPEKAWFGTWGTAIYTTYPNGPLTQNGMSASTGTFTDNQAIDQSFRLMIHPGTAGDRVRLHFSNAFGTEPLVLNSVSIAHRQAASGPSIVATTVTPLTFGGASGVTVPVGQEVTSDGVDFAFGYGDDLAVSFHAPGPTGPMSWHAEAFSTQYASQANSGDVTGDAAGTAFTNVNRGWFFLSGLDAQLKSAASTPPTIVFFGDSITDGFGSTVERNQRYPDLIAARLQGAGVVAGVVNTGINSNAVTDIGEAAAKGQPGVQRFARDALARANLGAVFVLLGTNDLSASKTAADVYAGLVEVARQAQARGACVGVGTILPRDDAAGWDATREAQRETLNRMLLASTAFDTVVDTSHAMENPAVANQPFQPYFTEGLHPNPAGYQVLANAIPVDPLLPAPAGGCHRRPAGTP